MLRAGLEPTIPVLEGAKTMYSCKHQEKQVSTYRQPVTKHRVAYTKHTPIAVFLAFHNSLFSIDQSPRGCRPLAATQFNQY
jgi:hypothetical protein